MKCSSDNKCLLCDITRNYILKDDACFSTTVENCALFDFIGKCLICNDGFYLNTYSAKCEKIANS